MRLTVNTGYDYCRRRRNEPLTVAQKSLRDSETDPIELLSNQEEKHKEEHPVSEQIELILLNLDPEDRLVVTLQYYVKHSPQEIAEKLDWSLSKAKVHSHRARKKLETALKAYGIEGI